MGGKRGQEIKKLPIEVCIERRAYVEKLMEWGALANSRRCIEEGCGAEMELVTDLRAIDGISWYCSAQVLNEKNKRVLCKARISVRTSSFFEGSHLTLEQICIIVRGWSEKVQQKLIARKVGVSKNTLIVWANVCRDVATDYCITNSKIIGGPDKIVDIDLLYGKKKFDTVQHTMLCGIERESGDSFIVVITERKVGKIGTGIYKWIREGTKIVSDLWREFPSISNEGLRKWKVEFRVSFVDPVQSKAAKNESTWWNRKHHTPCKKHKDCLAGFFAQFVFLKRCTQFDMDPVIEFLRSENKTYREKKDTYPNLGGKPDIRAIETKLKSQDKMLDKLVSACKAPEEIEAAKTALRNSKAEYKIMTGEDWCLSTNAEEILVTPILHADEDEENTLSTEDADDGDLPTPPQQCESNGESSIKIKVEKPV